MLFMRGTPFLLSDSLFDRFRQGLPAGRNRAAKAHPQDRVAPRLERLEVCQGLGLLQDPNARLLEAEDMLSQLSVFYAQRNMAQPEPLQQARRLLQQAREKLGEQPSNGTEAVLAYNQASELYDLAASGVGEVAA